MIETGRAADGSHSDADASTQHLVNPRTVNPTTSDSVRVWIVRRAYSDQQMQTPGGCRQDEEGG
jgi:hypothetical protein